MLRSQQHGTHARKNGTIPRKWFDNERSTLFRTNSIILRNDGTLSPEYSPSWKSSNLGLRIYRRNAGNNLTSNLQLPEMAAVFFNKVLAVYRLPSPLSRSLKLFNIFCGFLIESIDSKIWKKPLTIYKDSQRLNYSLSSSLPFANRIEMISTKQISL